MIQVLSAPPREKSFLEKLSNGIGAAVNKGVEEYDKYDRRQKFSKAFNDVKELYKNPDLSEQEKLISTFQHLGAVDPDIAKQLGGQLGSLGRQKESYLNKILGKQ